MRPVEPSEPGPVGPPSDSRDRPADAGQPRPNYRLHGLLFLATCLTTTLAGYLFLHGLDSSLDGRTTLTYMAHGLLYSVPIMGILLTHEMGHYIAARIHGVPASLPYFLPIPIPLTGTMGAVISMPERIRDRNALVDIGAAGPLAGLAVIVPVLIHGIDVSPVIPITGGMAMEGNSLLYLTIKTLVAGALYPTNGLDIQMHPTAWAGWVGLLVTMINLIPIGQLDGGHIAYGYVGASYNRASVWLHRGLVLFGVGASAMAVIELVGQVPLDTALSLRWTAGLQWVVLAGLILVMRRMGGGEYHPPVDGPPLTRGRKALCLLMLVVFAVILIPVPLRVFPPGTTPRLGKLPW